MPAGSTHAACGAHHKMGWSSLGRFGRVKWPFAFGRRKGAGPGATAARIAVQLLKFLKCCSRCGTQLKKGEHCQSIALPTQAGAKCVAASSCRLCCSLPHLSLPSLLGAWNVCACCSAASFWWIAPFYGCWCAHAPCLSVILIDSRARYACVFCGSNGLV